MPNATVGSGKFRYQALEKWEQLPPGMAFHEVAGVATDSKDRVYVFCRGKIPLLVFDRDGKYLTHWGDGIFQRPHGIFIGPDDSVYLTDDKDQTVRKFTTEGKLLLTLGTKDKATDTGMIGNDYRTIKAGGPPFNLPTNVALSPKGEMYITDGYGNARVHKFDPSGKLMFSWGEPGSGPGQFNLPHGIAVDRDDQVYVADRENSRVQIFDSKGKFLTEWTHVARPMQVFIDRDDNVYIAETGYMAGLYPWTKPPEPMVGASLSVFTRDGKLQCRWGDWKNPCGVGNFFAPHDLWIDSHGDIYVGEVTMSAGGNRGLVSPDCHCFQKFVRQ